MWILGLLLLAVAAGLYFGHRSKLRRLGRIVSTEVSTVSHLRELSSSMADGFGRGELRMPAAVEGKVRCEEPLTSELAQVDAVYYSMRVTREYEEERTDGDSSDKSRRRTSEQLAESRRSVRFFVEDTSGAIEVDPGGARFVAETALSRFEPAGRPEVRVGSFELSAAAARGDTLGYRFEEEVIATGRDVFILGDVTDPDGELRIGSPEQDGEFLISLKGRSQLIRELGSGARGMKIAAAVCGLLGLLLVLF